MSEKIPVPITFNPQKHHFCFLLNEIEGWKTMEWSEVKQELLQIGNNLIDLYLGQLSVQQICEESINLFRSEGITDGIKFAAWLNAPAWKKITLSDQSKWLLKHGNVTERYIHIHPAKYSNHTIRVRANTLKTVIALRVNSVSIHKNPNINLQTVNRIRKELLELSPIKSLEEPDSAILRLWKLFENYSPDNF